MAIGGVREPHRPPLLGRSDTRDLLARRLTDAVAGRGGLVWLSGEAGIGKTRLLDELDDLAHQSGALVLRGSGWEDPSTPAFWVWTQVLREAAATRTDDELLVAWGPRAVDALGLLSGTPVASVGVDRFPLFDSVSAVVHAISTQKPVVLLLDDLHWADLGSLRLLRFLTSAVGSSPVLIACGWRADGVPAPDVAEVTEEVAARGDAVFLEGLTADGVAGLIQVTSGLQVTQADAVAVTEQTRGNPLFVSEMARLAAARGARTVAGTIPASARATIRRRIARLSQPCHQMLVAASVAGESADLALVGHLVDRSATQLARLVDEAIDAGLLVQRGARIGFVHALLREAVYGDAPASHRRELHFAAAQYLGQAGSVPDAQSAAVAHHLIQALPLSAVTRAVEVAEQAARAAATAQAYEEAARIYGQLLDLVSAESEDRWRLLLAQGECLLATGDLEAARPVYVEAADLARRSGNPSEFARAALGFASGLAGFEVRIGDRMQTDLLEEALTRLPAEDSELRAYTLARLSVALSFAAPTQRREELAAEAVAMSRRLGLVAGLASALAAHCDAVSGPDDVELREAEATEIVGLAQACRDEPLELLGLRHRVVARLELGDLARALADIRSFGQLAGRLNQPLYSWFVPLWRGLQAQLAGDHDALAACADEVERVGGLVGSHNAAALAVVQRIWIAFDSGALDGLATLVAESADAIPELAPDGGDMLALFPGQPDAVRRAALPDLAKTLPLLPVDSEWLSNVCLLAVSIFEGDDDAQYAELLYPVLLPYAHRFAIDGIAAASQGSVERILGMLATMMGQYDVAEDHFERALVANAGSGAPVQVAATQRSYGLMLGRSDQPDRRVGMLTAAREAYRAMGITPRVQELDAMLVGPAVPPRAAPEAGRFQRTGAGWHVSFRGRPTVLKDVKGMTDLAVLFARPGAEVHVLDLVGERAAHREGDLGPVIDERARADYKHRLERLDEEIAEAEDQLTRERAESEREFLVAELTSAYGLGGRVRRTGDPAEKARSTVTWRIRDAIGRIEKEHPELGRHLRAAVRTGTYCSYSPEQPQTWEL